MSEVDTLSVQEPVDGGDPAEGAPAIEASPEPSQVVTEVPESGSLADRGDGRDDKGRFAPKGANADSTIDGAAKAEAAASDDANATGSPTAKADSTGQAPGAAPEADDLGPTEPLTWRSGNKDHEFPGALITKFGAVIPTESIDQLRALLGKATTLDEHREQIKQERLQTRYERETHQAAVAPILKEIETAFSFGEALQNARNDQETEQAIAALVQWSLGFVQQKPLLLERAALEREKRELAFQRELAQPDPEQQEQAVLGQLQEAVNSQIAIAKTMPEFKGLSDEDYADLRNLVLQNPKAFIVENEQGRHFNGNQFAILVRREARRSQQVDAAKQEQLKAAEASKRNAQRLTSPSAPPSSPPAAKAVGTQPASKPTSPPPLQQRDAWLKEMGLLH